MFKVNFLPRVFLGITIGIPTVYLTVTEKFPPWLESLAESILEFRVSTLAENGLPGLVSRLVINLFQKV